jgi:hypothetical protein
MRRMDGVSSERWFKDDKLHRDDGPAVTVRAKGQEPQERWYRNGEGIKPSLRQRRKHKMRKNR